MLQEICTAPVYTCRTFLLRLPHGESIIYTNICRVGCVHDCDGRIMGSGQIAADPPFPIQHWCAKRETTTSLWLNPAAKRTDLAGARLEISTSPLIEAFTCQQHPSNDAVYLNRAATMPFAAAAGLQCRCRDLREQCTTAWEKAAKVWRDRGPHGG